MDEYIERKAFYNFCKEQLEEETGAYRKGRNAGLRVAMSAAMNKDSIPAADVRPVVLCRDCKFWFNAPAADGFNSCELDALIRHENFFCAAGEKREES